MSIPESELPQTYDPVAIGKVWKQHPRCIVNRLGVVAAKCTPFAAKLAFEYVSPPPNETQPGRDLRYARRATELRELLTVLGPTFIKFGQALSIRPDVLPPPAVYELQKLCDAVPSYPTTQALALIEAELGMPPAQIFDGLDEHSAPIAAASLGQVYRCRLREGGQEVALKVQRPDMIRAVSLDLFLLRNYMLGVEWFKKTVLTGLFGAADRDAFDVNLLDTFARASYLELDYRQEAANLERFQRDLVPRLGGRVYVPACFRAVTSRKVLATEWIEGEQLAKSPPEVINRLISTGVACFLAQLLDVGFFHSDPHPGNLLVDASGRLVLIDFGLCAEIEAFDTRHLTSAIVNLMRGDVEGLVDDAVTLRFLPPDVDKAKLLPPLRRVFERGRLAASSYTKARSAGGDSSGNGLTGGDASGAGEKNAVGGGSKDEYGAVAAKRAQFAAISKDLNLIFFEFPFSVPEYFALITRALIVLEGIALTGDKDFDLFQAAYPLAAQHAARLFGTKQLASMLGEARAAVSSLQALEKHPAADAPVGVNGESEHAVRRRRGRGGSAQHALQRTLTKAAAAAANTSGGATTSWC